MADTLHSQVRPNSRHAIHNLTYPDSADRLAGTNEGSGIVVGTSNLYQIAKQDDDDSLWMLTSIAPLAWKSIGVICDLDMGYNLFASSPAIVHIDSAEGQGDLRFNIDSLNSFIIDLSGIVVEGTDDGFQVNNGLNYFRVNRSAPNTITLGAQLALMAVETAGIIDLNATGICALHGLNIGLNTASGFGTSAVGVVSIAAGTAPSTSPVDVVQLWVANRGGVADKGSLFVRSEDGTSHVLGDRVGIGTVTPGYTCEVAGDFAATGVVRVGAGHDAGTAGYYLRSAGGSAAPTWSAVSTLDHGSLGGLADDDHTQYALLAGRAGGQILVGGTAVTDDLVLRATAGAGASGSDIIFQVGNNGATEALRVLYDGKTGIGTAAPSSHFDIEITGTAKAITNIFEITNKYNAADMDGTGSAILFNNWYYDISVPAVISAARIVVGTETDWTPTAASQDSYMAFETALDGAVAERLRIKSNGYVGIGTNNPLSKLSLSHTSTVAHYNFLEFNMSSWGNSSGYHKNIIWTDDTNEKFAAIGCTYIAGICSMDIHSLYNSGYKTDDDIILRISANGNIGINTTTFGTSAAKVLQIANGTAPSSSPADSVAIWAADRNGVADKASLHLRTEAGVSHILGDLVGINTLNPLSQLHVKYDGALLTTIQARFENTTAGGTAGFGLSNPTSGWTIYFRTNPGAGWFEIADGAGGIQHRWDAKDYMIASDGKLKFSSESNYATGGTGSGDTNLYRAAAHTLKTDDYFVIAGSLAVNLADFSGEIGVITAKGSSNNGSSYIYLGRDSDDVTVAKIDTNGKGIFNGGWTDGVTTILSGAITEVASITNVARDLNVVLANAYSAVFNLAGCTGVADGLIIVDGTNYINITHVAANSISMAIEVFSYDFNCAQAAYLKSGTTMLIQAGTTARISATNLGINTATFGTAMAGGIAILNGTAGSGTLADTTRIWSADRGTVAGKAALHVMSEDGTPIVLGDFCGINRASPTCPLDVQGYSADGSTNIAAFYDNRPVLVAAIKSDGAIIHSVNNSIGMDASGNRLDTIANCNYVVKHTAGATLSTDEYIDLPNASGGWCILHIKEGLGEFDRITLGFAWGPSGGVGFNIDPYPSTAYTSLTDEASKFCVFDNGTSVRIKNRMATTKTIIYEYHYIQ